MGDGINIASRLERIAAPSAICLSEGAYRQVKARLDLCVSDLGNTQLKNIAEPIRIYSLKVGVAAGKLSSSRRSRWSCADRVAAEAFDCRVDLVGLAPIHQFVAGEAGAHVRPSLANLPNDAIDVGDRSGWRRCWNAAAWPISRWRPQKM